MYRDFHLLEQSDWSGSVHWRSALTCVAGRVSPRRATHFLLLAQEKVSKEKGSRSQCPFGVPCAAQHCQDGTSEGQTAENRTSKPQQPKPWSMKPECETKQPDKDAPWRVLVGLVSDFTRRSEEASSAGSGGSGARMFERSEFARTPPGPSNAAYRRSRATNPARLLFAYFLLAKQEKVGRPPGRDPACGVSTGTAKKNTKKAGQ